jgi:hypothetical protein
MYLFSLHGIFFMPARICVSPRPTLSLSPPAGGIDRASFCRRTAIALCCVSVRYDGSTDVTFVMLHLPTPPPPSHRGITLSYHCDAEPASCCSLNTHPVISFAVPLSDLHLSIRPVPTDPESLLLADYGCFCTCIQSSLLHHYVHDLPCELM